MMQCFAKAWLEDRRTPKEKVDAYILYWDRKRYFPDYPFNKDPVLVDGTAYVIRAEKGDEEALRWEKEDL